MENKIVNAVGLDCPRPIIETKKAIDAIKEGKVTTIVDNEIAVQNLLKFAKSQNFEVSNKVEGELFHVTITKEVVAEEDNASQNEENLVIAITSDELGTGARELGVNLMKGYVYALTEVDPRPKTLLFINSGVNLTVEDSPVLDSLKKLEEEGVEILSCGTCLNFYELADKLAIGSVSNMYTIVEKLNGATNTIKI
ncbi:sulfurtransferase-like selenium metabolism protein YedF [Clostridium sp. DL1XJH146]